MHRGFLQQLELPLYPFPLHFFEYPYLPEFPVIPRCDMHVACAHARDCFTKERRASAFDIIERGIHEDIELIAELREQMKIKSIYLLCIHTALKTLGDDLGQGDDGCKSRRISR